MGNLWPDFSSSNSRVEFTNSSLEEKSSVSLVKIFTVSEVRFEKSFTTWINNGAKDTSPFPK